MHKFTNMLLATALLLGVTYNAAHADALYTLTDIGNGTSGPIITSALNSSGEIVGTVREKNSHVRAFLYHNNVPAYLYSEYQDSSQARAINDSGSIVGLKSFNDFGSSSFLYNNGMTTYFDTPLDLGYPYATGITNGGEILLQGYTTQTLDVPGVRDPNGAVTILGTLGAGYKNFATSINDSGQVVGWSVDPNYKQYAFQYKNGVLTNLGTLGGLSSRALGINNAGLIVGFSTAPNGYDHAFLYNNGTMHDLGTLGGTTSFSNANAINATGDIVGSAGYDFAHPRAMLYKSGAMIDLNALIDPSIGWTLTNATAINANGQIIAMDASNRTCLLTPNVTIGTVTQKSPHVVAALVSTSSVSLNWMPINGATSYSVFRGTASGGPYTNIGSVSNETMYSDTTVQAATLYYYVVTAVNSHGSSANSNEAIAGTTLPGPISNLKTSMVNFEKIALTWSPAVNATGYEIYKGSTSGGFHRYVDVTINTNFTDREWYNFNTVLPNTAYYYIVRPINAMGVGPKSLEVKGSTTKTIAVKSLSFTSHYVVGEVNFTGTVTLSGPAPPNSEFVHIRSFNPGVLDFPSAIQVPPGASTCTFTVHPHPVTTPTYVLMEATCEGGGQDFGVIVFPTYATSGVSLQFLPNVVKSGESISAYLGLNGPATSANAVVHLTSSNPAALYVPPTAQLNSGLATRYITVYGRPVTDTTPVTVTATYGGVSKTAVVTVIPAVATAISSVAFSPTSAKGGASLTGTLTLNSGAPSSNAVVQLTSSNPAALYVPPTAQLNSGLSSRTFTAVSKSVSASTPVTVTATWGGVSKTTIVTVTP